METLTQPGQSLMTSRGNQAEFKLGSNSQHRVLEQRQESLGPSFMLLETTHWPKDSSPGKEIIYI